LLTSCSFQQDNQKSDNKMNFTETDIYDKLDLAFNV
jgi:hypothetical protein